MEKLRALSHVRTTPARTGQRPHGLSLLVAGVCLLSWVVPGRAQPIDIRVHDPVMIKQGSIYYLFCYYRPHPGGRLRT